MGIALGGADLGVTEQRLNHFRRGLVRNNQQAKGAIQVVVATSGISAWTRIRLQKRLKSINGWLGVYSKNGRQHPLGTASQLRRIRAKA